MSFPVAIAFLCYSRLGGGGGYTPLEEAEQFRQFVTRKRELLSPNENKSQEESQKRFDTWRLRNEWCQTAGPRGTVHTPDSCRDTVGVQTVVWGGEAAGVTGRVAELRTFPTTTIYIPVKWEEAIVSLVVPPGMLIYERGFKQRLFRDGGLVLTENHKACSQAIPRKYRQWIEAHVLLPPISHIPVPTLLPLPATLEPEEWGMRAGDWEL
ncbi:hypothetical protein C8R45DRAFT_937962 [Mycena sanguinolenta]|nr:hypothetical protein C8R45DRAFT_937962 [Mycena sanguinolenta]